MGYLNGGQWRIESVIPTRDQRYVRSPTTFRHKITADGSSGYLAESGRYHLYVSPSCPWAHRVLLALRLQGLEESISMSMADPLVGEQGWTFPQNSLDDLYLWQVYTRAVPNYTGRATVPVLWDKKRQTIVNNESREILRMLDREFISLARSPRSYCPSEKEYLIDQRIDEIHLVNNGVYRVGFAATQAAREEALKELFTALDRWEAFLSVQRFLCGDEITEADWCLFVTLIRFDCAYYGAFGCNLRRLTEYPHLQSYLWELYAVTGVAETCNFLAICRHYYLSYPSRLQNQEMFSKITQER